MTTYLLEDISHVFAAGCLGGFANRVVVWLFGRIGISEKIRANIKPAWEPAWVYSGIVWGGIWGGLFLVPIFKDDLFVKGILMSVVPTLVMLLYIFPFRLKKGFFGLQLGEFTPIYVFLVNMIWGIYTGLWLTLIW